MRTNYIFIFFLVAFLSVIPQSVNSQAYTNELLYSPTTADNLARAYWLLGNLDPNKDENIDQYLMIAECSLYTQFFKNDFEWDKIRKATRDYIKANREFFPRRFEFVQPIFLDRYDQANGGFALTPKTQIKGIDKIQISGNTKNKKANPCLEYPEFKEKLFPLNAVLNVARPFSYTIVKADSASAQEYLTYLEETKPDMDHGRPAFIRYRIKVEQSLGTVAIGEVFANFYGSIESVSVFGDRNLFIKLDEQKF